MVLLCGAVAAIASALGASILIPRLKRRGITGVDVHKPHRPEIPEMGGLALVVGFGAGILLAISLETFLPGILGVDRTVLLATLATVLLISLIGLVDDLLGMGQPVKALLPFLAALPLVAVRAGVSRMKIPFLGTVSLGAFYPLLLVPLGITGAANAVNMLAGFNGLELGMGLVAMGSLAAIASTLKATTSAVVLAAGIGASLGLLPFNWYPARIFVGDVGTLSIGALMAIACIVGDFETAGIIVIVPYAVDFLIKAVHRFPSKGWWGTLGPDGKLRCPSDGPVGFAQVLLKLTGGLHERTLVLLLMGIEAVFGLVAALLYARI